MSEELPKELLTKLNGKTVEDIAISVIYKNWRGEVAERKIIPLEPYFGKTEYHPHEQWMLRVYDVEKRAIRDYALKDIQKWNFRD